MIGLGTYAFFWQLSPRVDDPLSLTGALEQTRALGVDLFQICDYAPLEEMTETGLRSAARAAADLGITIELGTKGIEPDRIRRFLRIADVFDARLVRSMLHGPHSRPDITESEVLLRRTLPDLERAGVTLALETYEQVPTDDLVRLVGNLGSGAVGVCLDPANVVARLESPRECVEAAASHTVNVHVKDFAFTRQDGWVGFAYSGAPMGAGLHDYPHLLRTVRPRERGVNEIVEHWLPWQGDPQTTLRLEREWTRRTVDYLRSTP